MRFGSIVTVAAYCLASAAQETTTSLDVGQIISAYIEGTTLSIPAAESTSLASAINSVASTWYDSPKYTSFTSAVLAAAPSQVSESYAASGIPFGLIITESWYTKGVPTALQSVLQAQFSALDSAELKILRTPTPTTSSSTGGSTTSSGTGSTSSSSTGSTSSSSTGSTSSSKGNAAMMTAAPAVVMGVVGIVGAMAVL